VQLRATIPNAKSHEEFFLGHYEWLVKWALQLSHGQYEQATDLVHDLYVQLVRSRPNIDFEDEDRARGYLYTMLRHLSVSKARREGRDALSSLLIVDYESAEYGLRCVDRSKLILIRSDLARVCEYACIRRHTSRSASVLILRFFFGYYPSEIVRILQTTPAAVQKHLQAARQEARAYLQRPGTLRFLGQGVTPTQKFPPYLPDEPAALFAELRTRIVTGTTRTCAPSRAIEMRYAENAPQMEISEFAHVVSCERCLELTNTVLGLPSLAERFPPDSVDRDGGGNGSSGGNPNPAKLKKGVRQAYEHRPKKLQIAVDGEILAAQRISSARSELQVKLEPLAKPAFIEIFSEQGLRLAYLQFDEAMMIDLQPIATSVELSDGRHLEVKLTFPGGIPVVKLCYYDPLLDQCTVPASVPTLPTEEASDTPPRSTFRRIKDTVGKILWPWSTSFESPWPLGITVGAAILALVFTFNFLKKTTPAQPAPPAARTLLAKSRELERVSIGHGGAIHSTFSFQTLSEDGNILESQKVDSWRSLAPHRSALRLLDSKGRVLAGKWTDAKGKITSYNPGAGPRVGSKASTSKSGFTDAWELVPGGEALSELTTAEEGARVRRRGDEYEIQYEPPQPRSNPDVVSARLVLESSSVQPVSEDVTIVEEGKIREYRFRRLTYEVVPVSQIVDNDFTPPSDLTSLRSGPFGQAHSDGRTAHLMLEALQLLTNLGPDIEQIVDVERTPAGGVEVNGVFPTVEQKASVLRVFQPLHGEVKLDLHSGDEPRTTNGRRFPIRVESISSVEVESEHVPFDSELRSSLTGEGLSGHQIEERIREISREAIRHSSRMHREAWSIRQIAAHDFVGNELQSMPPEDKMLWLTLLDKHIRSFDEELTSLYRDLEPLFPDGNARLPASESSLSSAHNVNELCTIANALNGNADRLDRILTAGLTLSPKGLPANDNSESTTQLLATLRTEKNTLHGTIERLETFGQTKAKQ
jgi:RNA polymerase sigma factor (sigma-70 family)